MMKQYIDKSIIIEKIESLRERYKKIKTHNDYEDGLKDGRLMGYEDVLYKINSIESKEVDYNWALERARKEYKNHEAFKGFREMLVRIFPELRENENEDDLEKYFPIDLLTEEERKYAMDLNKKYSYIESIKYIKSIRNDFGLKSAKIYYDLYINNQNIEVDLEKEIELVKGDYEQVDVAWNNDFDFIARHFYELGLTQKRE